MSTPPSVAPSKNSVRKAGSTIRKFHRGECSQAEFAHAVDVMVAHRAGYSVPLVKVNNALRSFCTSLRVAAVVTQRLKKSPTIIDKLSRENGLDLSRMQDLGGCRVVFESVADLRRIEEKIRRTWGGEVHHEKDYITDPRESGYRGIHLIVMRDSRLIEIQLRTKVMHEWAELVEAFSAVTRDNLKQDGGHPIQRFMKMMSRIDAEREGLSYSPLEAGEFDTLDTLRAEVTDYLAKLQAELERNN